MDEVKLPEPKPLPKKAVAAERPVFDWDNMSYGDSEAVSVRSANIRRALLENDGPALETAFAAMRALVARFLLKVPRSWLIKGAPDHIDWSEPDNIQRWIKASKVEALGEVFNNPEAASGE